MERKGEEGSGGASDGAYACNQGCWTCVFAPLKQEEGCPDKWKRKRENEGKNCGEMRKDKIIGWQDVSGRGKKHQKIRNKEVLAPILDGDPLSLGLRNKEVLAPILDGDPLSLGFRNKEVLSPILDGDPLSLGFRNKEVLAPILDGDPLSLGLPRKKRAPFIGYEKHEGQPSPTSTKKRKVAPFVPLAQVSMNSRQFHDSAVEKSTTNYGELGQEPVQKCPPKRLVPWIRKDGKPDGRFRNKEVPDLVPLQAVQGQHSSPVRWVRKDGKPDSRFRNTEVPDLVPLQVVRGQHSPVLLQDGSDIDMKTGSLKLAGEKGLLAIVKHATRDNHNKNKGDLTLGRTYKGHAPGDPHKPTITGNDINAKKLPEVQKNGVRKPKRVQLTNLCGDKPDIRQLPNGNNVISSRVVKSLWSPPRQMKHIAEVNSIESLHLPRQARSTKFLSVQQLDVRPSSSAIKESEEFSGSDRTISDCCPPGESSIDTISEHLQPQATQEMQECSSLPLKRVIDLNMTISDQQIATKHIKETTRGFDEGASLSRTKNQKTRKQPLRVQCSISITEDDLGRARQAPGMTHKAREQATTSQQMTSGVPEGPNENIEMSPRVRLQLNSCGEQTQEVHGTDLEGVNGVPRMTPRTRKLTDAMLNFLHQKTTLLRHWKEMELGQLHPMALIGRSCKIYWPLDNEWYPGVIHEYNPHTRRHRIDYEDDEREWVLLGKERVKLHVSADESKTLELSFGEGSLTDRRKRLDADELAVLAAGLECQGDLNHGDLVWAKVKGYPMWPACVMDEEHASVSGLEPDPRERSVPVQFFGSYDHARINSKKVVQFAKGIMHKYHTKCKRPVFEQGLQEVERYLKECKLPDHMSQLEEEVEAVVNNREDDLASTEETEEDDQELANGHGQDVTKKTMETTCRFPLELGGLRVLALGKIVRDSEQFHTENHIWTEGYVAIRKYASMKDPEKIVEYKMEVVRNPSIPSLPLFRVTPEDDKLVEASTSSGCWKKILIKIQRAKEKAGLCIAKLLEKKRQSFRSGPSMFGFSNRKVSKLIQALPNARVCSKFTAWIERPLLDDVGEELAPAGYQPVEFPWEHLDRCNVCYLDEEYADNQLLQCDKCRTMVHMYCYGELEPPDGDLWLCNLCRPGAPKHTPFCCLCPVTGGAMKKTTDGRWAHLTCAMWNPETCLVDIKRMEPVDGISSINKERWKLICTVCKVSYGACIQCSRPNCRVAFHPLCARAAGFCTEVLEEKDASAAQDSDGGLQLFTYCKKHSQLTARRAPSRPESQQTLLVQGNCTAFCPPCNPTGCARCEPYNAASRRGHRQPEALAAAMAKRFFVENRPHIVTGCQTNFPKQELKSPGASLRSRHWKQSRSSITALREGISHDEADTRKTPQSTSERYRHMRSTLHERLTFGKSAIHGWGVFTKKSHCLGDMVIEYAGEIVRPIIADIRERRSYDSLVGAGTYMFRIDDERVVDATHAGSIAHLINHSCEPNCYSRVVAASGDDHIIIFAKRDIREGEELTYDYRFSSKDELLTCYCGCTGCRGSVNTYDSEEEPTSIIAPRSELTRWVVT